MRLIYDETTMDGKLEVESGKASAQFLRGQVSKLFDSNGAGLCACLACRFRIAAAFVMRPSSGGPVVIAVILLALVSSLFNFPEVERSLHRRRLN